MLLVHRGTNRTIMSDVGGVYGFEDITIKLDGEAPNFLSACDQLTSGRFKLTNIDEGPDYPDYFYDAVSSPNSASRLAGFDGLRANGGWQLFVRDDIAPDSGDIGAGWTVQIKAAVPQ